MLEIWAEPPSRDLLLEVDLKPTEEYAHKGVAQPAIRTLRGRTNRVLIGVPQATNVLHSWQNGEELASEIASLQDLYDFISVRLACSFVPDRGCSFIWGRLAIELLSNAAISNASRSIIAFDMFPREIVDPRKYKRSFTITPKLKFAFGEASVSATTDQEGIRYDPRMIGAGLLTDSPTWTFTADSRPGLLGTKELFLLIKAPKKENVEARFVVGAEVLTSFGPVPLRRYGDESILSRTFSLMPQGR